MNRVGCRMKYSTKKFCPFSRSSYEVEPLRLRPRFSLPPSLFFAVGKLTTNSERKDLQRVNLDFNEACLKRPFRSSRHPGTNPLGDKRPAPSNCCGLCRVREGWKIVLRVSSFLPLSFCHLTREEIGSPCPAERVAKRCRSLSTYRLLSPGRYHISFGYWRSVNRSGGISIQRRLRNGKAW